MSELNICLINDSFPPEIDGVVNAVLNYAEILSRDYGQVTVVTPEEMDSINHGAMDVIRSAVEDIRSGNTSPAPVQDGMKSPCEYCAYTMACPFDTRMKGGTVQVVDHRRKPA